MSGNGSNGNRFTAARTRFFVIATILFSALASAHPAPGQIVKDDLVFKPLPSQFAALKQEETQNSRQIQILEQQLKIYSEYLASKGESVEIRFQRHLSSLPQNIFILGASSGTLVSGAGLLGLAIQDSAAISKRFFWAGAIITIFAAIGSHYLQTHYADRLNDLAREKMVEELDATPNAHIRSSMEVLMVKQLLDLKEQNHAIHVALENDTNFSPAAKLRSGINPRFASFSLQKQPFIRPWRQMFNWNGF